MNVIAFTRIKKSTLKHAMIDSISEIKPGMVVKSKGSVIPMSVNAVDGPAVGCYWFIGSMLHKAEFPYGELLAIENDHKASPLLAGHRVALRSGSPVMKVERIEFTKNKPHAVCTWQQGDSHFVKKFNSLALRIVQEES